MSTDPELTSAQAADLVGLSRPFVKACIESGDLQTHRTAGPERLVLRSEVLRWHERLRASQRQAMAELVNQDDEYELEAQRRDREGGATKPEQGS